MKITKNFDFEEFIESDTALRLGIDNTPTKDVINNINFVAKNMELVRTLLGNPIIISSGYRSPQLNKAIGGSKNSDHMLGYAVDFVCKGFGFPIYICTAIAKSEIPYTQLIQEGRWVHISFNPKRKKQVLTAHFDLNGKATYTEGLV